MVKAKYVLKLYIAGNTSYSQMAIRNLHSLLKNELKGAYVLKVIDVVKNPQLAEDEKILATPVLEKQLPEPVRRILGDLSDKDKVLIGLDIVPEKGAKK